MRFPASGSRPKLANFNAEALTFSLKVEGDTFGYSSPSGYSYDAKLDGADVPIKGDIAGTTASVKKLGDNIYQETDKRAGKVVGVTTFTVGADGKLNVVGENKLTGPRRSGPRTRSEQRSGRLVCQWAPHRRELNPLR